MSYTMSAFGLVELQAARTASADHIAAFDDMGHSGKDWILTDLRAGQKDFPHPAAMRRDAQLPLRSNPKVKDRDARQTRTDRCPCRPAIFRAVHADVSPGDKTIRIRRVDHKRINRHLGIAVSPEPLAGVQLGALKLVVFQTLATPKADSVT